MRRQVEVRRGRDETWQALRAALADIGTLEDEQPSIGALTGKIRYGANPVRVRASVMSAPAEGSSVVTFDARGQDIFGVASRKVVDRLLARL